MFTQQNLLGCKMIIKEEVEPQNFSLKKKTSEKKEEIKKKIQNFVGFDNPEYIENKSYEELDKMLDELYEQGCLDNE